MTRLMLTPREDFPLQWLAEIAGLSFDERRRLRDELRDRLESADGVPCAFPRGKSPYCMIFCVRQCGYAKEREQEQER